MADGTEVEICSWLDDHSRYLLGCTAFGRVGGDDVVATFSAAGEAYGWPAATLTDNGAVYTSRFTGGRNGFEYLLAYLGIRQKNGAPGHPQTQGKVERFHQTLKRWLGRQPAARTLAGLQAQLDTFRLAYNEQRPHRATGRFTPLELGLLLASSTVVFAAVEIEKRWRRRPSAGGHRRVAPVA
jgi:transposase InsO family protein